LKFVQERGRHVLQLTGICDDFLNRTQNAQQLKEMIDKLGH
jgi:hypothetical protein